ncbi:MAG: nucleotide exchange factor GrpE [Clostridia bacterium]|nr:nucleotide exchange factor GrpE [Clostridia bacterium]
MEENKNVTEELEENETAPEEQTTVENENDVESEEKLSKADKKKLKKAEEEIAALEAKLSEADDKYMRLYAEYDNFRRRSQKEKEGTYADAYIDALTQILPVLDNLERAAAFGTDDAEHPLAKGLELTLKSFSETMEKMGVAEIPALGEKFDPNVHNAVMHVDDETLGENEVVEVFMKGYIRGDKVLRHSMVKVAN